jgi:Xaa-Pro aminopeptidase
MIEKFANFGIKSVPINTNLVDLIWPERPEEKIQKIIYLSVEECGEEPSSKLAKVREELKKQKCDGIILSQLDDICCK